MAYGARNALQTKTVPYHPRKQKPLDLWPMALRPLLYLISVEPSPAPPSPHAALPTYPQRVGAKVDRPR